MANRHELGNIREVNSEIFEYHIGKTPHYAMPNMPKEPRVYYFRNEDEQLLAYEEMTPAGIKYFIAG